ncbi:MAG: alpha-1,2-fucosyltransferase [Lachnospiraceae bacterium]|nr:alpha-1,2-fucosyltransferase [Lachnospiraceae bacterium]
MIIVRFSSGLGNQMFQYSFYRFLKTLYKDTEVKADLTWFYSNNDHHGYELQRIFGKSDDTFFNVEEASKAELFKVTGLIPNLFKWKRFEQIRRYPNRIIREFTQKKREPYIIDQLNGRYDNDDASDGSNELYKLVTGLDTGKDWYIMGFWIEEKYLRGRLEGIRRHFRFPDFTDDRNIKYMEHIRGCNSVSLHVRRGDYLSSMYSDMFVALDREYYEKAVNYIKERVEDPYFFVFSDDGDFVGKEFEWLDNKEIVEGNEGEESFRDMQLMSLCKHNIIANSTFSQWGALLNENEDRIVVYPKAYLKDKDNELKEFEGWVRL